MINLNVLKHELNFHEWTYFMLYWSGSSLWEKYNILCNFLQLSHPQAAVFAHREGGTLFPKHLLGLVHYLIHTHTHKHTHYICTIYILCINIFVSINLCFFGFVLFFTKKWALTLLFEQTCAQTAVGGGAGAMCLPPNPLRLTPCSGSAWPQRRASWCGVQDWGHAAEV